MNLKLVLVVVNGVSVALRVQPDAAMWAVRDMAIERTDNMRAGATWEMRTHTGLLVPAEAVTLLAYADGTEFYVTLPVGSGG